MFTVKDIIDICNAKLLQGDTSIVCNSFCKDTRIINNNDVYVGIKGDNFDGNLFYIDAINKGVKVCILDKLVNIPSKYKNITILLVDNSILCLQQLAKNIINNFPGKVIAVTGSVGKTSTKDMIYSVVKTKYKTLKTIGNNNNHIGLPLTILKYKDEEVMILEMGMNNFNEINILSNIAKPDIAVITNIGTAHIGNLGSRENILKAKLEVLEGLKKNGTLIINNDNDMLNKYYNSANKYNNILTVGIDNKSDYMASNIKCNNNNITFNIKDKKYLVNVPSVVFVYNSLIAYSVGKLLNIDEKDIYNGILNFELTKNRLDIFKNNKGITIIDDTYNASYDSVVASLSILKNRLEHRKILVLGDILELGDYSEEIHRKLARNIIDCNIDILITVGNDIKYTVDELINNKYNKKIYSYCKYNEIYDLLDNILTKDDVILLKASHSINLTEVVNHLKD